MNQCKRCDTLLEEVSDYEHVSDDNDEEYVKDDGYLCPNCECFHLLNGNFEWFVKASGTQITQLR